MKKENQKGTFGIAIAFLALVFFSTWSVFSNWRHNDSLKYDHCDKFSNVVIGDVPVRCYEYFELDLNDQT